MRVYLSGAMAHLVGDWSVAGVTQSNLDTLAAALRLINPTCAGRLQIDCRQVDAIDATGRQILTIWMQCARLRGVEPELVIPTNKLRHIFQGLGLRCRFTSWNTARHSFAPTNHRRRRSVHEDRADQGNCQAAYH